MLRLGAALLARLARPRAPLRRCGAAAAGGGEEQERFVFLEYEPEPAERAAAAALRRERQLKPRRERRGAAASVPSASDPSVPPSGVSCSGCGAELQCGDGGAPGFVPAEKYRSLLSQGPAALRGAVCQRCWALAHHGSALRLRLPPAEHRRVLRAALRRPPRHGRGPLLLYVLDVTELPDPVLPQLPALLGPDVPAAGVLVVGNKVDLLPADCRGHLGRLRQRVAAACGRAGLRGAALVDIRLVSAKTGYGVEGLVSRLQRSWKCAGDVYLLGATNSGKSTLFNTLLRSDYCKSRAPDIVDRATVSPWPGTTLNLLKFPIINPTCDRIFRRQERLKEEATKTEDQLSTEEKKYLNQLKKQGYLVGRVGRTFQQQDSRTEIDFDPDLLSYSMDEDPRDSPKKHEEREEFTHNEVKDARWCFDTPGIIKEDCVLNLLTEKEVKLVLPSHAIVPRTFILKPGMVLFLAALGRIDYLEGEKPAWFSVLASNLLPVHVTTLSNADALYEKHAGQEFLKVPMGGEERMKEFPPLVPQDITLKGIGTTEAVADIKLSSAEQDCQHKIMAAMTLSSRSVAVSKNGDWQPCLYRMATLEYFMLWLPYRFYSIRNGCDTVSCPGWVAVTAHAEEELLLRAYTPKGTALVVREPPLLPFISAIRGARIPGTPAYRTKKPPSFVENLRTTGSR